ncbi:hypothetical protein P4V47_25630 [Brevibacillus laterosporus]|uniref:hypothetical protein n=1 Tax=Brevibacillus laterosporus TaxID=1465 RepID=UPI002E21CC0B|nr:hypothetical protein [Brevibacillus laterosporus]
MGAWNWIKGKVFGNQTIHAGTQTRSGAAHPFTQLNQYVPNQVNVLLYKEMREALPVLDVGIQNLRRLIGTPIVKVGPENSRRQKEWNRWEKSVKVGKTGVGFPTFISAFTDALVQNGYSTCEILPLNSKTDIYALIPIEGESLVIKNSEDPTELILAEHQPMEPEPVPYPIPEWIVYTAYEATPKNPYGRGILAGLPFLVNIILTVFDATGRNWERFGDLKYNVDLQLPDGVKPDQAKSFIEQTEKSWEKVMAKNRKGKVQDFIGTNVKISVIGSDLKPLELEVPVRVILEQLVAKTGLPPFVFGFSWSSRESMTKTQADILTTLIWDWRQMVTPAIHQIAEWWCRLRGYPVDVEVEWPEASLQDVQGEANAELTAARAENQRLQNIMLAKDLEEQGYLEEGASQEIIERRKGNRQAKTKRYSKGNDDDGEVDPARLSQKEKDSKKIEQIAKRFERKTLQKLKQIRENLFYQVEERALKSLSPSDIEDLRGVIEEELSSFLTEMTLSEGRQLSIYDFLLRSAGIAGFEAAVEDIQREIDPDAVVRSQFDFSAEYVQSLRSEGMDIVVTRAIEMKEQCLAIMERHATVGDNPSSWANSLQRELGETLDEKRWYWRRLARSEAAMMFDRSTEEEYALQGHSYVTWVNAPDACLICRAKAGKVYPLRESPRIVKDTHPHCRCRKMVVTDLKAEEARENGKLETFDRKGVNILGTDISQKHGKTCRCH